MNASEASKKFYSAVVGMACSNETVHRRLIVAFTDLGWVQPNVLPEEIRPRFLKFCSPIIRGGKKLDQVIGAMSEEDACQLIHIVCEIHDELARSLGGQSE
jgi:hypothetical protein